MTAKHTPGPWFHDSRDGPMGITDGKLDKWGYKGNWIVGGCGCCRSPFGVDSEDEALANACLIAAAPDLLDALEKFIAWICNDEEVDTDDLITLAGQAIDKAKGLTT